MVHKSMCYALLGCLIIVSCKPKESISNMIESRLAISRQQALLLAVEVEGMDGRLPQNYANGKLNTVNYQSWVSGFFPGVLWYLYQDTPTKELKKYAELYTARVEPAKDMTTTHDLGFMLNCSLGNGFRLTGNSHYLDVMKRGAMSLISRYNDKVKAIKSWNTSSKWQYPVIIDNMMNLEFLISMAKETGDTHLMDIANAHAITTMQNHFRKDNSCYHVVSYDTITGKPHAKQTHQGYSDSSAWARGQAWALYGYTMMYRETGRSEYLDQARKVASFILNHPKLPKDKIPYWDFDDPNIPNTYRDASAAAVMASAFIELSTLDKGRERKIWLKMGEQQLRSLSSKNYFAEPRSNGGFIIKHSVGNYNKKSEIDAPLMYADYYYIEALLRLKRIQNEK